MSRGSPMVLSRGLESMAWWHKRLLLTLHLALLTTGAYFIADAVNLVIARNLEASTRPSDRPPTIPVSRASAAADRSAYQRILQGDLFHPAQRGLEVVQPEIQTAIPAAPLDLPLILVGTVEGLGEGAFAILEDRVTHEHPQTTILPF